MPDRVSLEAAIVAFLYYLEHNKGRNPKTIKTYKSHLKKLSLALTQQLLHDIDSDVMEIYITKMQNQVTRYKDASQRKEIAGTYSPITISQAIVHLRYFFKWCVKKYGIASSPMIDVEKPRLKRTIHQLPSMDDVRALLDTCWDDDIGIRDRAMILLMYDGMARRSDIPCFTLDSTWLDRLIAEVKPIVWEGKMIAPKFGDTRTIFYSYKTAGAIRVHLSKRPIFVQHPFLFYALSGDDMYQPFHEGAINLMLKRRCKRAGIALISPHDLRRLGATNFYDATGDIEAARAALGHSSIETTQRHYIFERIEDVSKKHQKASIIDRLLK
jgi:integrase/recombinase XerD